MTATQSLNFFIFFSLIIGDKVNPENIHWKVYLSFRKILDIVLMNSVFKSDVRKIPLLVHECLSLYKRTYNCTLKPKLHHLLHYENVLDQIGPLVKVWAMRNEGKHRQHKRYSNVTFNRKNLPLSLCRKDFTLCLSSFYERRNQPIF